jgi:hypothetical protein
MRAVNRVLFVQRARACASLARVHAPISFQLDTMERPCVYDPDFTER